MMGLYKQYPSNWQKVSRVIKRIAGYQCEECKQPVHSVHHKGAPLATGDGWRPGDKKDKHDVRRENLIALCFSCHDFIDNGALTFYAQLRAKGQAKRRRHRRMGLGTGLVPLRPVCISSFHWFLISRFHRALLAWSKRAGRSCYRYLDSLPQARIVDSYLIVVVEP